jgi:hypothetical protein
MQFWKPGEVPDEASANEDVQEVIERANEANLSEADARNPDSYAQRTLRKKLEAGEWERARNQAQAAVEAEDKPAVELDPLAPENFDRQYDLAMTANVNAMVDVLTPETMPMYQNVLDILKENKAKVLELAKTKATDFGIPVREAIDDSIEELLGNRLDQAEETGTKSW